MTGTAIYLLASLVPLALLVASAIGYPAAFVVQRVSSESSLRPTTPVLLYQRGRVEVFYTSADLLYPNEFGPPGAYIQAVVFDVWPKNEGHETSAAMLDWSRQIGHALRLDGVERNETDETIHRQAFRELGGEPNRARGEILPFELPVASTYRQQTGIELLVAAAVKQERSNDSPQLLRVALESTAKRASALGVEGLGIPYMDVSTAPPRAPRDGWRTAPWAALLGMADGLAKQAAVSKLLLGSFTFHDATRSLNDQTFWQAWQSWHTGLAAEAAKPAHAGIRMPAICALSGLLSAAYRGRRFTIGRALAICVFAGTAALALVAVDTWIRPLLAEFARPITILSFQWIAAALIGVFIEDVARFDARKAVGQLATPEE